jgi:hypothetical protein
MTATPAAGDTAWDFETDEVSAPLDGSSEILLYAVYGDPEGDDEIIEYPIDG